VKKSGNKKSTPNEEPGRELRWTPLFVAFRDACEWALNVAVALARGYPEEVEPSNASADSCGRGSSASQRTSVSMT